MPKARSKRHRQQEALSDEPCFEEGQQVVRVTRALGENIYETEDEHGAVHLYRLPSRLRYVVFIRRGSYVFVRDDATRRAGKVRGDIETVVLDAFLRALQTEPFWPPAFKERAAGATASEIPDQFPDPQAKDAASEEEHWEIGAGNPNRRPCVHEHSDSEDE